MPKQLDKWNKLKMKSSCLCFDPFDVPTTHAREMFTSLLAQWKVLYYVGICLSKKYRNTEFSEKLFGIQGHPNNNHAEYYNSFGVFVQTNTSRQGKVGK